MAVGFAAALNFTVRRTPACQQALMTLRGDALFSADQSLVETRFGIFPARFRFLFGHCRSSGSGIRKVAIAFSPPIPTPPASDARRRQFLSLPPYVESRSDWDAP